MAIAMQADIVGADLIKCLLNYIQQVLGQCFVSGFQLNRDEFILQQELI